MLKNKIAFINKNNGKELAAISLEGSYREELEPTRGLVAYDNGINENDIIIQVVKTDIKPFSSGGKYREVEVNNKPLNSSVIVCGDMGTAILEASNGDTMQVKWEELTSVKHTIEV